MLSYVHLSVVSSNQKLRWTSILHATKDNTNCTHLLPVCVLEFEYFNEQEFAHKGEAWIGNCGEFMEILYLHVLKIVLFVDFLTIHIKTKQHYTLNIFKKHCSTQHAFVGSIFKTLH